MGGMTFCSDGEENYDFYVRWLYQIVNFPGLENYQKVLTELNSIIFFSDIRAPLDKNRIDDAYSMRDDYVEMYPLFAPNFILPPSILEVMVALVRRYESTFMYDPRIGNRCGFWFEQMLHSLELDRMTDDMYDEQYVLDRLYIFLNREYTPKGHGGLFTVRNPPEDMRSVDIWMQGMWWMSEYCEDIDISEEYYEK